MVKEGGFVISRESLDTEVTDPEGTSVAYVGVLSNEKIILLKKNVSVIILLEGNVSVIILQEGNVSVIILLKKNVRLRPKLKVCQLISKASILILEKMLENDNFMPTFLISAVSFRKNIFQSYV